MLIFCSKCDQVHSGTPLMMSDQAEMSHRRAAISIHLERVCTSLSINTWGLDWTHLKSLAVNERDCEVTRLYRAIIICLWGGRGQSSGQKWPRMCEVQRSALTRCTLNNSGSLSRQLSHAGREVLNQNQLLGPIDVINAQIDFSIGTSPHIVVCLQNAAAFEFSLFLLYLNTTFAFSGVLNGKCSALI